MKWLRVALGLLGTLGLIGWSVLVWWLLSQRGEAAFDPSSLSGRDALFVLAPLAVYGFYLSLALRPWPRTIALLSGLALHPLLAILIWIALPGQAAWFMVAVFTPGLLLWLLYLWLLRRHQVGDTGNSTIKLRFESRLAAPVAAVWARVATMEGVNAELAPWIRMTFPGTGLSLSDLSLPAGTVPLGQTAFHSWLLAFGLLPIDRHALGLERIYPGSGFDERSHSWLQRTWIHRRRLEAGSEGTRISDELEFEPRLPFMAPLTRRIVQALFQHRHRRLRRIFGAAYG